MLFTKPVSKLVYVINLHLGHTRSQLLLGIDASVAKQKSKPVRSDDLNQLDHWEIRNMSIYVLIYHVFPSIQLHVLTHIE